MKFDLGLLSGASRSTGQSRWELDDEPSAIVALAGKADELGCGVPCSDHVVIPGRARRSDLAKASALLKTAEHIDAELGMPRLAADALGMMSARASRRL